MYDLKLIFFVLKFYGITLNYPKFPALKIIINFLSFCGFLLMIIHNRFVRQLENLSILDVLAAIEQLFFDIVPFFCFLLTLRYEKGLVKLLRDLKKFDEVFEKLFNKKIPLKVAKLINLTFIVCTLLLYIALLMFYVIAAKRFKTFLTITFNSFFTTTLLLMSSILSNIAERILLLNDEENSIEIQDFERKKLILLNKMIEICEDFCENFSLILLTVFGEFEFLLFVYIFKSF